MQDFRARTADWYWLAGFTAVARAGTLVGPMIATVFELNASPIATSR